MTGFNFCASEAFPLGKFLTCESHSVPPSVYLHAARPGSQFPQSPWRPSTAYQTAYSGSWHTVSLLPTCNNKDSSRHDPTSWATTSQPATTPAGSSHCLFNDKDDQRVKLIPYLQDASWSEVIIPNYLSTPVGWVSICLDSTQLDLYSVSLRVQVDGEWMWPLTSRIRQRQKLLPQTTCSHSWIGHYQLTVCTTGPTVYFSESKWGRRVNVTTHPLNSSHYIGHYEPVSNPNTFLEGRRVRVAA
jgi:hypothetical protein